MIDDENDKITIVTGFFDCGRGEYKNQERSNDKYFNYFDFWARIQNDVVIFGSDEVTKRALDIRRKYGREKQTRIVVINNPIDCAPEIYDYMRKVENTKEFKNFRIRPDDISNSALYDYIMFLKFWMLKYVADNYDHVGNMAWLDFGYNHGGDCFIEAKNLIIYGSIHFHRIRCTCFH
jgi:Bacterial protein of unknown function (HtrL_YibB).